VTRLLVPAAIGLLLACARAAPDQPPPPRGLDGQRVMVLPVLAGDPPALNTEITARLATRAPTVDWVAPEELQRAVDRQPGWRVRLDALSREIPDAGRSPYLGDAAHGELRRLGAVVDADLALIPISVRGVQEAERSGMEMTAAIVEVRSGRVLWLGTVRAVPEDGPGRNGVAAVAEALARALFPT
jgi:hypothetical protein